MAQQKRDLLQNQKDWLQKNRNMVLYGILLLSFLGLLCGWKLLPDPVQMTAAQEGEQAVTLSKNAALGAHFLLSAGFGAIYWFRPREIVYFLASILGLLLTYGVLYINVGL